MPATWKAGPTERRREAGYTYPVMLILLVAAGLALQTASLPSQGQIRRDREAELLFRGRAYRDAIAAYWQAGEAGNQRLPARLADLIEDPRETGRRHLRRLYDDPMPGGGWRVVTAEGGGIAGVVSSAPGRPRQRAFFRPGIEPFDGAESYAEWRFVFDPGDD